MHWTQFPLPSHSVPLFWLQATIWPKGGVEGAPFVQMLCRHWLPPVDGLSVSSTIVATMLPLMQMSLRQSPCTGFATIVPSAVLLDPHWPAVSQENVLQAVLVPQSEIRLHCTQAGADTSPLQRVPLFWLQGASSA